MGIDRRSLSRISRELTTGMDTEEDWRMVRVPASEEVWLAWKLYCEKAKVSMGRALSALIESEVRTLIEEGSERPLRVIDVERAFREREVNLVARETRLRALERNLSDREHQLAAQRLETRQARTEVVATPDVGRNEPCPCGSGRKYKRCHGKPT